jgi:hypothetical protein
VVELYDLAADPGETRDVAGAHPDVVGGSSPAMDAAWSPAPFERRPWVPTPRPGGVPEPVPDSGGPGPGPGPGGPGAPDGRLERGALRVRVPKRVRKAAKVERSLHVGLASGQRITEVQATLSRRVGGERVVVARGRVAVVDGRATVRLQVLGRIRKRRYTLRLVGRNADGTRADKRFTLRFK